MKNILFILLLFTQLAGGTNYYVKNGGSDSNTGLSDSQAFETVSHMMSVAGSGDVCYLNRGNVWYERMIIPHSDMIIDAYGTGDKPEVNGILVEEDTIQIKNIYTQASGTYSFLCQGTDSLWIYRCEVNGLNNATYSIGIIVQAPLSNDDYSNVTIEECEVYECGAGGWGGGIKLNSHGHDCRVINNTVTNNTETNIQTYAPSDCTTWIRDIYIAGNTVSNNYPFEDGYGTGINIGWTSRDVVVEKNYVYNTTTGIQADSRVANVVIKNNLIKNTRTGSLKILANQHGDADSIYVYNNTCISTLDLTYNAGLFLGLVQGGQIKNSKMLNNIVYSTKDGVKMDYYIDYSSSTVTIPDDLINFESDYNVIHNTSDQSYYYLYDSDGGGNSAYTLSQWRTFLGTEANTIDSDPLIDTTTFKVSSLSPALDIGTTISEVTDDYWDIARPQGAGYDIGAYEYPVDEPIPSGYIKVYEYWNSEGEKKYILIKD